MGEIIQYLLHMPWWQAGIVAMVGVWLFGNRRTDKTLQRVGAAIALVAVLLGILGYFYLTPLQKAVARTRQLVHDVDRQNWADMQNLLDDQTVIAAANLTVAGGKEQVLDRVRAAYDRYGVKSVTILGIDGIQTDTLITVTVNVMSTQDATADEPDTTTWQLDFQQNGDAWELEKITLIHTGGEDGQRLFNPF